jgi:hypothetical protein
MIEPTLILWFFKPSPRDMEGMHIPDSRQSRERTGRSLIAAKIFLPVLLVKI